MQIHGARKNTHKDGIVVQKLTSSSTWFTTLFASLAKIRGTSSAIWTRQTRFKAISERGGRANKGYSIWNAICPIGKKSKDHAGNPQGYATIMIVDCRIEFCNGSTLQPTDFRPEDMVRRIQRLASSAHPAAMPTAVLRSYCLSLALRWTKPMGRLGDLLRLKI